MIITLPSGLQLDTDTIQACDILDNRDVTITINDVQTTQTILTGADAHSLWAQLCSIGDS